MATHHVTVAPEPQDELQLHNALRYVAGGSLIAFGLASRSKAGLVMATVGGGIVSTGLLRSHEIAAKTRDRACVKRTKTIVARQEDLFDFWQNPDNVSRVIPGIESIRLLPDGHWQWRTEVIPAISSRPIEWETELVASGWPNFLHWRAVSGAPIEHEGAVRFQSAPGDRGTEVELTLTWKAKGALMRAVNGMIGKGVGWHSSEALRRAKQLIETGELTTATAFV